MVQEQAKSLKLTIEKYIVCVGRKVVGEKQLHEGDKWIEEFACINIFEEIFNNYNIQVLSDYNTATAEYNFILLFAKEEENQKCMDLALPACGKIQEEVERYLNARMNLESVIFRKTNIRQMPSTAKLRRLADSAFILE